MPDFITSKEAAEFLRVSEKTIARFRARGELPFQKVGSGVRYRLEHVKALLHPGESRQAPVKSWTQTRHVTEDAAELPASILRPARRAAS
jgi:excisionase family DNA binding protein